MRLFKKKHALSLKTKLRIIGLAIFGIGCIGVGVRETNSYLVTKTVIVQQTDRIYPVWGNGTLAFYLFIPLFFIGFLWTAFILGDLFWNWGYMTGANEENNQ